MLEREYQAKLIKKLGKMFPGCQVLKNDTDYLQGIPDLTVLYKESWAILEVKAKPPAPSDFEPNQEWYLEKFGAMSFSACIYPENEKDVLSALQRSFEPGGNACVS